MKRLHAEAICCGHDFRFGRHASAGVIELAALCDARGIEIDIVPAVKYEGKRISSTWIRELIGRGEVDTAAKLLGRAFGYDFTVVPGKKLGRTIDSPTINQRLPNGFVAMRHGVYASASMAEGKWYPVGDQRRSAPHGGGQPGGQLGNLPVRLFGRPLREKGTGAALEVPAR